MTSPAALSPVAGAAALPLQVLQLVVAANGTAGNSTDAGTCVPDAEGTGDIVVGFLLLAGIAISFMPQVSARVLRARRHAAFDTPISSDGIA